ncbi:MAG: right-handed parallel beta-helix repeat-containing protein, partial [Thermoplasmatales archaeon]
MKKEIYSIKVIVLLLIMAVSGCLEVPNSGSKTIYVNDGGGVDYVKIQDAIDNASDGDTIFVYNGTYNEILILNKSINLIGASKDKTVIGWQKIGKARQKNVICVYVDKCTIKGFKIVGAGVYSDFIGINVNTSYNTISDNIILSNNMGVNIGEGSKNNNVYRNNISNNLYGVALHHSNNNNISKNNISSCSLYGIYLIDSNNNIIFGNTLSGNFYGMRVKASEKNRVFKNLV